MENFFEKITSGGTDFLIDLIVSLLILIVGFKIVGMLEKSFKKEHKFSKLDPSVKSFIVSFIINNIRIPIDEYYIYLFRQNHYLREYQAEVLLQYYS